MQEKVEGIIIESLKDYSKEMKKEDLSNPTPQTVIYGSSSVLDSLGLVYLLANIEDRVFDEFGKSIVLADEKAMSQKISPFRNVKTLASYIITLIKE